ncbi:MAG TPA: peptidylprolyl isomerase [Candidatus Thermoplasmatota archaeon]|nr:peptidylprolyl isomerase [Candidatus Thermoplasmatota archaeon]
MRTASIALSACLVMAGLALAGCTKPDADLVKNDCTEHPSYGTGNPHVRMETSMGNITAEIFVDKAPNTGMNFVKLVESGVLDGSPFHRIISNFMMQGGDFTNRNGTGGVAAGDCADEQGNVVDEYNVDLRHDKKGILSMANTGQPNSGSSQFFITFGPTGHLDAYKADGTLKPCGDIDPSTGRPYSCHAVFGAVTEGLDVLDKVNAEAATSSGTPRTPVALLNATVMWP